MFWEVFPDGFQFVPDYSDKGYSRKMWRGRGGKYAQLNNSHLVLV